MNKKTFVLIALILLFSASAVDAWSWNPATWISRAFKIGDAKDIDLNSQAIGNGNAWNLTCQGNCSGYSATSTETNASNLTSGIVSNLRLPNSTNSGWITVYPNQWIASPHNVFFPNGTEVNTTGTTSVGIIEALTTANASKMNVRIIGGADATQQIVYNISSTSILTVARQGFTLEAKNIELFGTNGTAPLLDIDTCMMCVYDFGGSIFLLSNASAKTDTIRILPRSTAIYDATATDIDSTFIFGSLAGSQPSNRTGYYQLNISGGGQNYVLVNEVAGGIFINTSGYIIDSPHMHSGSPNLDAVTIGSNGIQNIIRGSYVTSTYSTQYALNISGSHNIIDLTQSGSSLNIGELNGAATGNQLRITTSPGNGQFYDNSTGVNIINFANQPRPKVVTFTIDVSTTGNQQVADVGFRPKGYSLSCAASVAGGLAFEGYTDGTTSGGNTQIAAGTWATAGGNNIGNFYINGTNYNYIAAVNFTNNGFWFSKTKTGTPTGTATCYALVH